MMSSTTILTLLNYDSNNSDPVIRQTLLVGCKRNKILEKGEVVAEWLLELELLNAENYILLSSMYESCSQWMKMSLVRKQVKDKGIKVVPGCTSIEVDGLVHEFVMGDWSHPESKEIEEVLRDISKRFGILGMSHGFQLYYTMWIMKRKRMIFGSIVKD